MQINRGNLITELREAVQRLGVADPENLASAELLISSIAQYFITDEDKLNEYAAKLNQANREARVIRAEKDEARNILEYTIDALVRR